MRTVCVDCGVETLPQRAQEAPEGAEYYMVQACVWRAAGLKGGMCCVLCLEQRIGRRLVERDFTSAPINRAPYGHEGRRWAYRSQRLTDRLGSLVRGQG